MSFTSVLTWKCIELQSFVENHELGREEKANLIEKHLISMQKCDREDFPEMDPGWEWFNTSRGLTVGKDFLGCVTVVDFFTYCCINCMHILPDLHELEEKYPPSIGLIVVGIHSAKFENEKTSANILSAIRRYGIHHPVVNDSEAVLWNKLEITCWPTLLILGPDAKPLFVIVGEGHRELLFQYVDSALKFYASDIQGRALPLLLNEAKSFRSHLFFPGRVCTANYATETELGGNSLIVSDTGHHRIVVMSSEGNIKLKVGGPEAGFQDGDFSSVRFRSPQGITFCVPHYIYVADTGNHSIRKIDLVARTVRTVAGSGSQSTDKEGGRFGTEQDLASPWDVCLVSSPLNFLTNPEAEAADVLLIANAGTHQIWALALQDVTWWKNVPLKAGQCIRIAGSGAEENRNNSYPTKAAFAQPSGICCALISPAANKDRERYLYIADSESSSIRQMSLKDGAVKAVVGGDRDPMNLFRFGDQDNADDPKATVLLQHPLAVAWNASSQLLFVADSYNHKIKTVDPLTKATATFHGSNSTEIALNEPGGLCIDAASNTLYVADTNNHCIRKIDLASKHVVTLQISDAELQLSPLPTVLQQAADFQVSAEFPKEEAQFEWCVQFRNPETFKWAEDAPHTWKLNLADGLEATETQGQVHNGEVNMSFRLLPSAGSGSVRLVATLFLCSLLSGVCIRKNIAVELITHRQNCHSSCPMIKHELNLNLN